MPGSMLVLGHAWFALANAAAAMIAWSAGRSMLRFANEERAGLLEAVVQYLP